MSKLDDLRDQFDTTELLEAVDSLDTIRSILADGDNLEPPRIRNDLMKLHGLAMQVVNQGYLMNEEMISLAGEIEWQIEDIIEAAERVQKTVSELVQLCPTEEDFDEDDEE